MEWILCVARPGCETKAREHLEAAGLSVVLPTKMCCVRPRGRDRRNGCKTEFVERAIWSGYIICGAAPISWDKLRSVFRDQKSHLMRPVMFGGKVASLSTSFVEELCKKRWDQRPAGDGFSVNDRVRFSDGPLAEYEGQVIEVDGNRAPTIINLLGKSVRVTDPSNVLRVA